MRDVYRSPYAGSWYPGDAGELRSLLSKLFRESEKRIGPWVREGAHACLVPHAGLIYSGVIAAAAYRYLAVRRPSIVVILGFHHGRRHPGIVIPELDGYETPLREVAIDSETVDHLTHSGLCRRMPVALMSDHSVEIQLPLIQWAMPGVRVVPMYVGDLGPVERERAAEVLAALPESTVLLASSDLTHYGRDFRFLPFPADSRLEENLWRLDFESLQAAGSLEPCEFLDELDRSGATVCGRAPIALLLETMKRKAGAEVFQHVLDYRTSHEITGDDSGSVSYGSAAYFPADAFALRACEGEALLDAAQASLVNYAQGGPRRPVEPNDARIANHTAPGVFVAVCREGRLRGCLGRVGSDSPLRKCVPELALSAALDDARFAPSDREACDEFDIEISVLTPRKRISSPERLRTGVHGAVLERGLSDGLLLPKVGRREGWTRERFLQALALKAGLAEDEWPAPDAKLSVFQAFEYKREMMGNYGI
jgi:AmmeMemoRadiSam system protein B/AmmeMemoRadiSam system protein A